jgi:trehalose/maltose transport system permease protein
MRRALPFTLPRRERSRRALARRLGLGAAVALIAGVAGFPFYWAVVSSLEPGGALFAVHYWPAAPTLESYRAVFAQQAFGRNLLNSTLVAACTVALSLGAAVPAAYALGRVRFRGRTALLFTILAVSMFPQVAVLSGLFELVRALGLYNRWPGLAFSYTLFTLPFTVWVLTVFGAQLPRELEEAALVDGASPLGVVWRIFVPLLAPAMVTSGLLALIAAWNEFLFALTFTLNDAARTVPVAIALITGASAYELPWGRVMAASVIVTLPLVALVLVFQRRIVAGLTAGAVKG